jgi:hypothetical protein
MSSLRISIPHIVLVEMIRAMDDGMASSVIAPRLAIFLVHLMETWMVSSMMAISSRTSISSYLVVWTGQSSELAVMVPDTNLRRASVVRSTSSAGCSVSMIAAMHGHSSNDVRLTSSIFFVKLGSCRRAIETFLMICHVCSSTAVMSSSRSRSIIVRSLIIRVELPGKRSRLHRVRISHIIHMIW